MIRGALLADGLAIGEIEVSCLNPTSRTLKAKAAFIRTQTGETCGWTTMTGNWSPETLAKLEELKVLMEVDLGRIHFASGGESVTAPAGLSIGHRGTPDGLGEHLGDGD